MDITESDCYFIFVWCIILISVPDKVGFVLNKEKKKGQN